MYIKYKYGVNRGVIFMPTSCYIPEGDSRSTLESSSFYLNYLFTGTHVKQYNFFILYLSDFQNPWY